MEALRPFELRLRYRAGGRRAELAVRIDPERSAAARTENAEVSVRLELDRRPGELVLRPRVAARRAVELDELETFALSWRAGREARVLENGWQSWSPTRVLGAGEKASRSPLPALTEASLSRAARAEPSAPGRLRSELFTAVREGPGGEGLVAGFLGAAHQFGGFSIERRGVELSLRARLDFEGVELPAGGEREGEPLLVQTGDDVAGLLDSWAERIGAAMRARRRGAPLAGWCSWYEYFTRIDEPTIRSNLVRAADLRAELGLDLFQIDDGYEAAIGDWTRFRSGFPHGLAALAREVRAVGLRPGLWLAPLVARPESRLAREHPGWLLRDAAGRPRRGVYNPAWGLFDSAWALDATNPEVQAWLAALVETAVRDWGFSFLKLDFLFAGALDGRRHDRGRTGAEALRCALEVIREAAGDDVHLLGCGCPLGPAIGVVDSMRVGADVAPYWSDWRSRWIGRDLELPSLKNAIRNTLARAFLHGRLWQTDPDCLLVRDRRTRLTEEEVRAWASVVAVSGGTLFLSDELGSLPADRLAIARRARELRDEVVPGTVRSLDLFRVPFPRTLWARRRAGGWLLAVLNPDDRPAEVRLSVGELDAPPGELADGELVDAWTGERLEIRAGALVLGPVAAHGARLVMRGPGA